MKKTVLFALPLVALMLTVACKKQEAVETAAPAAEVAAPAAEATPAAVEAAPAAAPVKAVEKKGK